MSLVEVLDTLFLKPLYLLFEVVYVMSDKVIGNPGWSIIVLSLFINLLILPLYMRADKIQEEEHALERKIQKGVDHIKKTFRGDERMMMLQTYYRQNDYKPVYVLRSATSLFLQIPFFIAAYRFLSGLQLLNGASFGLISDLGMPDGILQIAGISVNVLPVIMTIVNLASCVIFTKGSPLKEKVQLYTMALFFLVFLYASPAGLVFYWTLNNIFSLAKTIFCKMKNPNKVFAAIFSTAGVLVAVYGIFFYEYQYNIFRRKMLLVGLGLLMQMPCLYCVVKKRIKDRKRAEMGNSRLFFTGGVFLAGLTGILIPSAVIKTSPLEFVDLICFYHPLWFIVSASCMAFGVFVIWMGVFYRLAKPSVRKYFDAAVWVFSGIALIDYMYFGKGFGILSAQLRYETEPDFMWKEQALNACVVLLATGILYVVYKYSRKIAAEILAVGSITVFCMAAVNIANINSAVNNINQQTITEGIPQFRLSRTGQNVIVLMLDRAIGAYVPYLFDDRPELEEQFSGFTYYANTLSFGGHTIFGAPAIFGGYEYTPMEMNKRDDEPLVEKHNEALKVMPVLFNANNFDVVVCDPPFAGYQWIPDLTIYDEYPDIQSYILEGKFTDASVREQEVRNNKRNFFCYSIFKSVPVCIQGILYDKGNYNRAYEIEITASEHRLDGPFRSVGINPSFMKSYSVLNNLTYITDVADGNTGTFLMISNEITHNPMLLQEPEFEPALRVDNVEIEMGRSERINADGRVLKMVNGEQSAHYHANMAAMIQLGKWFDYMRQIGVYDNTRIILVSDHGSDLRYWDGFQMEDGEDLSYYYPLLMVKDFNSEAFTVSEKFMTNGDVPTLAMKDIINTPINPFTGKEINSEEKVARDQYIITLHDGAPENNNGNTFARAVWYAVHDDMRKIDNWELAAVDAVLPVEE